MTRHPLRGRGRLTRLRELTKLKRLWNFLPKATKAVSLQSFPGVSWVGSPRVQLARAVTCAGVCFSLTWIHISPGNVIQQLGKHRELCSRLLLFSFLFLSYSGSCYVAQFGLELVTHLPLRPECWDYGHVPLCQASLLPFVSTLFLLFYKLQLISVSCGQRILTCLCTDA